MTDSSHQAPTGMNALSDEDRLGYVQLTTQEGGSLWVLPGVIWGVERAPNETFTVVKTAAEPVYVAESPAAVFRSLVDLNDRQQKAVQEEQQKQMEFFQPYIYEGGAHSAAAEDD